MGTIAEKLQAVKNSKAAIKLALENKGKTPGDTLADYADKVGELVAIDGLDGAAVSGAIPSKAAETIVPGTTDQIIAAGQYLAGNQTIQGDGNLLPENIKKGTSVFGVTGTYETPLDVVNGIIEEYKAVTDEISANTFVEFVIKGMGAYGEWLSASIDITTTSKVFAVKLTESKVLLSYYHSGSVFRAQVATITESNIVLGTAVNILSQACSGMLKLKLVALNETTVIVSCVANTSNTITSYYGVHLIPLTIDGTDINVHTKHIVVTHSPDDSGIYSPDIKKVTDDTVAVLYGTYGSSTYRTRLVLCKLDNVFYTFTKGTATNLHISSSRYSMNATIIPVTDTYICVFSGSDTSKSALITYSVDGLTLTLNNNSIITPCPTYQLSGYLNSYGDKTFGGVRINDNTVLLTESYAQLNGMRMAVLKINNGTPTLGTFVAMNEFGHDHEAQLIDENTVYISGIFVDYDDDTKYCGGILVDVSTDIPTITEPEYIKKEFSVVDERIFSNGFHAGNGVYFSMWNKRTGAYLFATKPERAVIPATTKIEGITKTAVTPTVAGEVYLLNKGE